MAETSHNIAEIYIYPLKGYNAFAGHFPADRNAKHDRQVGGKRFFTDDMMLSILLWDNISDELKNKKQYSSESRQENTLHFGVTAKKKTCRKAVVRNRIKRLFRESLRKQIAFYLKPKNDVADNPAYTKDTRDNLALIRRWHSVLLIWNTKVEHPAEINLEIVDKQVSHLMEKALRYTEKIS